MSLIQKFSSGLFYQMFETHLVNTIDPRQYAKSTKNPPKKSQSCLKFGMIDYVSVEKDFNQQIQIL